MNVQITAENPTHHISLSDGKRTIGIIACDASGKPTARGILRNPVQRTAMKTTQGNLTYSDMDYPWVVMAQDDFSNGRGLDDFESNTARFFDSMRANTWLGKFIHGPQEVLTTGYRSGNSHMPGSVKWLAMLGSGSQKYQAAKLTITTEYEAGEIQLLVRKVGEPADLSVELRGDNTGNPLASTLTSASLKNADLPDVISEWVRLKILNQPMTGSANYWLVIYSAGGTEEDHWEVAVEDEAGSDKRSNDGTTWESSDYSLYYRVLPASTNAKVKFFEYRYMRYLLRQEGTSAPKVYINGDRGMADDNTGSLNKLIDASKNWTPNEYVGAVVMVIGGTGITESQNWRTVTGNTINELLVDTNWVITHDTTTEYVILGTNAWREISGHGLTAFTSSICVVNNICYFPQGDSTNLKRMQWNTSTGLHDWADDGTNKAVHMTTVRDSTNGLEIWKSNNKDANGKISVAKAAVAAWGTNLTFGTALEFADDYGRINNIVEYGEEETKNLWIFREGMVYDVLNGKIDKIPIEELRVLMAPANAKAVTIHNVYMLFGWGAGIERYYDYNLDDVGPNRDKGLPAERQGSCIALLGNPGSYFAAYDGGVDGYSCILVQNGKGSNGAGWHEIYRGAKGERIQDISFQPVYNQPDRLWVAIGDDVFWLYMPSLTLDPTQDSQYRYTHESVVVGAYMHGGMPDLIKLFNSIKIFSENLKENEQYVMIDYQVETDTTWNPIREAYHLSPMQEQQINRDYGVNAKRFRWRLRSQTHDCTKTPKIKAVIMETIGLMKPKFSYTINYRLDGQDKNLRGETEDLMPEEKQDILDEWVASLTPLVMRCVRKRFDNKRVFIDPMPLSLDADHNDIFKGRLVVVER